MTPGKPPTQVSIPTGGSSSSSDDPAPESRGALRRQLRHQRNTFNFEQRRRANLSIQRGLLKICRYQRAKRIGAYWPNDGEPDLLDIFDNRFFLPVLREGVRRWQDKGLLFGSCHNPLSANPYGIPEPQTSSLRSPRQLDLLLIPLVGFDGEGNRLGMGGGYYDRAIHEIGSWKPVFKLGVAFSFQALTKLPTASWDRRLDAVITENELVLFS